MEAMSTRPETEAFIRFQLGQLASTNQHHTFERISEWIARRRLSSNIIPATGPVSAGGDQGRDAETFFTTLPSELPGAGGWIGTASSEPLVVASTVQKSDLRGKIKSDVNKICSEGEPVSRLAFFSVEDVPVSVRHDMQAYARNEYDVRLEIFDGQAVATQLADPDLIWVAERYLQLPSHLVPEPEKNIPDWYQSTLQALRENGRSLITAGDFSTIRHGLRYATFNREARPDLPEWLAYARQIVSSNRNGVGRISEEISMRARYEIVVASLCGMNALTGLEPDIRDFVKYATTSDNPALIEDAVALSMYCGSAWERHIGNIDVEELQSFGDALTHHINALLADVNPDTHPMRTAQLLAADAFHACRPRWADVPRSQPGELPSPEEVTQQVFELRKHGLLPDLGGASQLVELELAMTKFAALGDFLPRAPVFPVERMCDLFELLTPLFIHDDRYDQVREAFDAAIARVEGDNAVADRCRRRALALRKAGEPLKALQQFHDAKVNWWHGDTMRGSLLAVRMIAQIHSELGLLLAAKQYALAAATVAHASGDNAVQDLIPEALAQASEYCYQSGAWFDAVDIGHVAILAHANLAEHPFDHDEHPSLSRVESTFGFVLMGAELYWPEIVDLLDPVLTDIGYTEAVHQMVNAARPATPWTEEEFLRLVDDQLHGRPFSDAGPIRHISFAALDTHWHITARNERRAVLACERFAAAAQVLLAELATSTEILLLDTDIEVEISIDTPLDRTSLVRMRADNTSTRCTAYLPPWTPQPDLQELHEATIRALVELLLNVTVSPAEKFMKVVEDVFERGLVHKLNFGRPYDESADLIKEERYRERSRLPQGPLGGICETPAQAEALRQIDSPGPGYNHDEALSWIKERYEWLPTLMSRTLPTLRGNTEIRQTLITLRSRGWLDWHLVLAVYNVCLNYRARPFTHKSRSTVDIRSAVAQLARIPEPDTADPVPLAEFTLASLEEALDMASLATAKRFGLDVQRANTPNIKAIQRLLTRRYGYLTDDCPHEDVLALNED
jgi:hypothetical protein